MNLFKFLRTFHLYLGLVACVPVLVLAVTGTLLVFRDEIEQAVDDELHFVTPSGRPAPLDASVAAATLAAPGTAVSLVTLAQAPDRTVRVLTADGNETFVDPYSLEVLGRRDASATFFAIVDELHLYFLLGERMAVVVGSFALGATLLTLTGLYIWWPRGLKWRKAVRLNLAGPARVKIWNIHRTGGFYASVLFCLISLTGAGLAFQPQTRQLIGAVTGDEMDHPERPKAATAMAPINYDRAVAVARAALPNATIVRLAPPSEPGEAIRVQMRRSEEPYLNGRTNAFIDPVTYELMVMEEPSNTGQTIVSWIIHVHMGFWGGAWGAVGSAVTRGLWLVAMLASIAVIVTGPLIWLRKQRKAAPRRIPDIASARPSSTARG